MPPNIRYSARSFVTRIPASGFHTRSQSYHTKSATMKRLAARAGVPFSSSGHQLPQSGLSFPDIAAQRDELVHHTVEMLEFDIGFRPQLSGVHRAIAPGHGCDG